jgi:hypothetical protein
MGDNDDDGEEMTGDEDEENDYVEAQMNAG